MRNRERFPPASWEGARPFSGPHLEVGEGGAPAAGSQYPLTLPRDGGGSGGDWPPPTHPCPGPFQLSTSKIICWTLGVLPLDLSRC